MKQHMSNRTIKREIRHIKRKLDDEGIMIPKITLTEH